MSMENAKEFLKKILDDEALKERLTGKEPEEVLADAKELGLKCTQEELEEAAKSTELTMDEMTDVAGGINMDAAIKHLVKAAKESSPACTNPGGHNWVYTHHEEEENSNVLFATRQKRNMSDRNDVYFSRAAISAARASFSLLTRISSTRSSRSSRV